MDSRAVLELFRKSRALLEGHFELSSGRHSGQYFQCALLLAHPEHAAAMAWAVCEKLAANPRTALKPDLVLGPALGAVVWAQEVARALGTRAYFSERDGGVMTLRRGFALEPGERVLVVEDVLTTGGSVREVLALVAKANARCVGVASIVNRSGEPNPFAAEGLPYTALAEVEAVSWDPRECPLCATPGAGPAVKPGSRPKPAARPGVGA
jgi:orotate phosphoribosyltransferase